MTRIRKSMHVLLASTLTLSLRVADAQYVTTLAGSGVAASVDGTGPTASFAALQRAAVDAAGNVFVTQWERPGVVRKITPSGVVSTLPGTGRYPQGVATDPAGAVYITEQSYYFYGTTDAVIRKITPDGQVTTFATLYGDVMAIGALSCDTSGNLYVADQGDTIGGGFGKLLKVAPGGHVTALTFRLEHPWDVAVDRAGNLYVTDSGSVLRLGADGSKTVLASGLKGFTGIAPDRSGGIYVSEAGRNRILRIAPDGAVTVVAGSETAGSIDGPGHLATFDRPFGLALDGSGNLYVADTGNNKIRKIALGGFFTDWTVPSVARTAGSNGSFWTSDVTVHNRGAAPVALTFKFLGHDADRSDGPERDVTIEPYQTVTYADVLASVFGIGDGSGALRVRTDSDQIAVRSRTSTPRAGGSVGAGVPGVRTDRFFTDETAPSPVLIGLREDDAFRSNIVLVNASPAPITVLVTASGRPGAVLGERSYTLPAGGMIQDYRFLLRPEFGGEKRSNVTVTVSSPTPGALFTALVSVIDNASNDPTAVLPQ